MVSIDLIIKLLTALNAMTPIGIIALLSVIIFLLASKRGPVRKLGDNHITHVQAALEQLVEIGKNQSTKLDSIDNGINYLKGKLDK